MLRRLLPLALSAALVAPLAACGGDDGAGDAASLDEWCDRSEVVNDLSDGLDAADPFDPAAVEAAYTAFRSAVEGLSDVVPAEVRDDLATLTGGVVAIDEALAEVDYNFLDVDLSTIGEIADDMDEASERMRSFNQRECGFEPRPESDDDATDFDPTAGTARDQLVTEFVAAGFTDAEARCIADRIDISQMGGAQEMEAILEVFELCDISLERLAELGG